MKKIVLSLVIISLISCNNITKNNSTDSDSIYVDSIDVVENVPYNESKNTEITLDFSSYHLYTCEDDKYDSYGYQPVSAKVTIDEENKKASLKLYDSGENRWFPFNFRIDEKLPLQEGVITYTVYNNANQKGYIYVSTNRPGGLFIDINNFVFNGDVICCWMQESGSSGSQYRQEAVTIESTPNTYSSNPSYTPILSSSSIDSEERNTNNHSRYSNYEETDRCVDGVVVYEGDDDFYIVENRSGYTVLERYFGTLYEGERVRGELNKYGFTYLIKNSYDAEVKVYIEDYMLTKNKAIEWLGEKKHLKSDDQRDYDTYN